MKYFAICLMLFVPLAAAALEAIETPAGPESLAPGLAATGDGAAVLTWLEKSGTGHVLKFSRFDDGGFAPAAEIARGDDWFANWADTPGLFVLPNGDWLAHWLEKSGPATFAYDVRVVRSTDRGRSWSEPVTPHRDGTPTEHGFVSYFARGEGRAGIVWLDGRHTVDSGDDSDGAGESGAGHGHHGAGPMTLRTAELAPDGGLAGEFVLDEQVCDCCQTAAGVTRDGPVVVYRDRDENEIRDISIVRHDGEQWSAPRPVHRDGWRIGGCPVNGPDLIARDLAVVVAWFSMPEGRPRVRLARSGDAGASFSEPADFSVDRALGRVQLAWWRDGFLMLWMAESEGGNGGAAALSLAYFDSLDPDSGPAWKRQVASVTAGRASGFPRILPLADDRLLLAWTESDGGRPQVRVGLIEL